MGFPRLITARSFAVGARSATAAGGAEGELAQARRDTAVTHGRILRITSNGVQNLMRSPRAAGGLRRRPGHAKHDRISMTQGGHKQPDGAVAVRSFTTRDQ